MNMRENSTYKVLITIENDENIQSQNSQLNFNVTVCSKCVFAYCFFSSAFAFSWISCTVHRSASTEFGKCNFKTRSYNIIYTFKNYFVTVFLTINFQFSAIDSILTYPNNLSFSKFSTPSRLPHPST